jgi:hypothetical protein
MNRFFRWIIPMLAALVLAGCLSGPTPSAYYILEPGASAPDSRGPAPPLARTIGIGPVTVPAYLDRAAMVTRIGPNRVRINDDQRWAAPLQDEILRVLAADLADGPGVREVIVFPWASTIQPDLWFQVQVRAFEGQPGDKVHLVAVWRLTSEASGRHLDIQRTSRIDQPAKGSGYAALAAAMGQALDTLSREMLSAITEGDK